MKNKVKINREIPINDLHYLAGIIDANSNFYLYKSEKGYIPNTNTKKEPVWNAGIKIKNTDHSIIHFINQLLFLGNRQICTITPKVPSFKKKLSEINISGPILDLILDKITVILRAKKRNAEILMEYRKTVIEGKYSRFKPVPADIDEYRNYLKEELNSIQ